MNYGLLVIGAALILLSYGLKRIKLDSYRRERNFEGIDRLNRFRSILLLLGTLLISVAAYRLLH